MPSQKKYILSVTTKKIAERFLIAVLILTAGIVSAGRYLGIGADYDGYVDIFVQKGFVRDSVEPAYRVLRYINDWLFGGQVAFIYFASTLTALYLKMRALGNLSFHPVLILCFYFLSFFFIHEYTQIRAAVAIGVFLCSIKDINRGNPTHYFYKVVIATLFHYSAIIMVFCWIYVRLANTKKKCVLITIIGLLFSIFVNSFSTLAEYIYLIQATVGLNKSGAESDFMSSWNAKYLMLLSLFIYISIVVKREDVRNFTLYQIFSFSLCCYYYLLPAQLPVISVRLAEFYAVVFIILLVNIAFDKKYCTKQKKYMILTIALTVSILYGYAAMKTISII